MPDRDYYLSNDPKLAETKAKYLQHLTKMLTLAGETNAAARAKAILEFETKIAQVHWTRAESRDATKTYNKLTLAELRKTRAGLRFPGAASRRDGANVDSVVVSQPSAFKGIARAGRRRRRFAVLKDQLLVRSLDAYSAYLPQAFDQENFAFYGTMLNGTPQQEDRVEAGGQLHRRHARRRRQQALRRAATSRPRPRRRPTSWSTTSSPRWTSGSTSSTG